MRVLLLLILTLSSIASFAQKKEVPYVILISFDGFRYDYVSRFNPPFFKEFIKKGVAADGLIPSFPSKTFPNHYTLVTGMYPGHHGLVDNQFYDPSQSKRYTMRDRKAVLDTTFYGGIPLWQLAQRHGMKSASYFWVGSEIPLRGRFPDYYFPYNESVPNIQRVDQAIAWLKLPEKERPHFMSLYFSLVDSEGHKTGPQSSGIKESVLKADSLLAHLVTEVRKIDLPVNIIVVSDHGMFELKQEQGTFIPLFTMIDMNDTSVVVMNGGTQTHIYTQKTDSVYAALKKQENHFKIYKKAEMPQRWHYDNVRTGDLLIVADPGYYILDQPKSFGSWNSTAFGVHGYDPLVVKEMQGIFYAMGPNFKKGVRIKAVENIHVYPLIATILGLEISSIDGKLSELEGIYRK